MIPKSFNLFIGEGFQDINDACGSEKMYMDSHKKFQERLRKTLYYEKYADGTLPSPIVTDVAVRLINSKTSGKKSLDKQQATRLTRRARISPCALMMGILYTERLAQSNPNYLKKVSSSDLFMVSMLVASKYLYDDGEDDDAYNYDWSKAGNYHVHDLNRLEREFLNSIQWRIFVSSKEFFEFVNKVETRVAIDQAKGRGWYSYVDMSTLLENVYFQDFLTKYLKSTGKTIFGCTLAYSLSVALLLSTPTFLMTKNTIQDLRSMPSVSSISFTGQIAHSEYSSKISQTVRRRQRKSKENVLDSKHVEYYLWKNETRGSSNSIGNTCDRCGLHGNVMDNKLSVSTDQFRYGVAECISCRLQRNGTGVVDYSFTRVMSFVKSAFHNRSWLYGSVQFPVWENSYSVILIGFSTSSAAAA